MISYVKSLSMGLDVSHLQEPFTYQRPTNYMILPPTPLGSLYLKLIQNEFLGHKPADAGWARDFVALQGKKAQES